MCNKKIFFREFGEGKPMVFLHGICGCSDFWIPFVNRFSKHFRILIIDLPNHGKSCGTGTINFSEVGHLLYNFFFENDIEKPIVVAHSYGAKIAFQMLSENPSIFSALVAVDMLPNTAFIDENMSKLINFIEKPLPLFQNYTQIKEFFAQLGFLKSYQNLLLKSYSLKNHSWKFNASTIVKDKFLLINKVAIEKKTHIPVLVLKGETSEYVQQSDYDCLLDFFENITLCKIKNSGHWIPADNPEGFCTAINEFLNINKLTS